MLRYLLIFLLSISFSFAGVAAPVRGVYPAVGGECVRYEAYIESPRTHVSGLCVLRWSGDTVRGILVNEFGLTALAFEYNPARGKVRLTEVSDLLNHWYVRRILRRDLAQLMRSLQRGDCVYVNSRRQIKYELRVIND